MRSALVFLVLLPSACGNTTGDGRRTANIERAYEVRDARLVRNVAADDTGNSDSATIAHAVAMACSPETEKLLAAANRDGDSKVAAAIRQDSEFRARGYVLKARGQPIF
jgi:hypothetical protein